MGTIKAILIAHGEKLGLVLVALFSLWVIAGNLVGGYDAEIKPDEIEESLETIKAHLNNSKAYKIRPEILRSTKMVAANMKCYRKDEWSANGWDSFYALPPVPEKIVSVVPKGDEKIYAVEEEIRPRIATPSDVHVKVGGRRMALVFREGMGSRRLKNVRAMVWRKAIGDGKTGAKMGKVYRRQMKRKGIDVDLLKENRRQGGPGMEMDPAMMEAGADPMARPGRGFGGRAGFSTGDLFGRKSRKKETRKTEYDESLSEVEREKKYFEELEKASSEDLSDLLDKTTTISSEWELVAKDLKGYTEEPDMDKLLEGKRPELEEASDDIADGEYSRKWFYVVENFDGEKIMENVVYRYRVVIYAQPVGLPEEYLTDERYKGYVPYVSMGNERVAMFRETFNERLESIDEKEKYAPAELLNFEPLVQVAGFTKDEREITFYERKPAKGKKERKLREELALQPAYSQFMYSDYVLTPVRTRYDFISTLGSNNAVFRVEIINDRGRPITENFQVVKPELPPESEKQYRSPYKKYPMDKVIPVPIGGEKAVKGIKYDFSTGWGLVDIRDCEIETRRYTLQPKLDERGRRIRKDGEVVMEKKYSSPLTLKWSYVVIREIKGKMGKKPRFKRLLRHRPQFGSEKSGEDIKAIWNPTPSEEKENNEKSSGTNKSLEIKIGN
jgi:hypothetical protein